MILGWPLERLKRLHRLADFEQPLPKRRHMMSRHGALMFCGGLKERKQSGRHVFHGRQPDGRGGLREVADALP